MQLFIFIFLKNEQFEVKLQSLCIRHLMLDWFPGSVIAWCLCRSARKKFEYQFLGNTLYTLSLHLLLSLLLLFFCVYYLLDKILSPKIFIVI